MLAFKPMISCKRSALFAFSSTKKWPSDGLMAGPVSGLWMEY